MANAFAGCVCLFSVIRTLPLSPYVCVREAKYADNSRVGWASPWIADISSNTIIGACLGSRFILWLVGTGTPVREKGYAGINHFCGIFIIPFFGYKNSRSGYVDGMRVAELCSIQTK